MIPFLISLVTGLGVPARLAKPVLAVAGAVLLIGAVIAAVKLHDWQAGRTKAAQAKVEHAQTGAFTNSASDAVNTQANVSANEAASDALTRSNEEDIRNAEGSNAAVNPAARDAGLRSLCKRAAYRDSERCRLLQPHP